MWHLDDGHGGAKGHRQEKSASAAIEDIAMISQKTTLEEGVQEIIAIGRAGVMLTRS